MEQLLSYACHKTQNTCSTAGRCLLACSREFAALDFDEQLFAKGKMISGGFFCLFFYCCCLGLFLVLCFGLGFFCCCCQCFTNNMIDAWLWETINLCA